MDNSPFHKLSRVLWAAAVALVVLLAMYVSMGRYLMSNIGVYQGAILEQLNKRLPFTVNAAQVRGDWRNFNPELVLTDLQLSFQDPNVPAVVLDEGRFTLDAWETVTSQQLSGNRIQLSGLELQGSLDEEGIFAIAGFGGGGGGFREWFESLLRNVERLALIDNRLSLALPEGESRDLLLDLQLLRSGSQRVLNAELQSATGTRIDVKAEGLGNPFNLDTYTGELYLDIDFAELESLSRFLPNVMPVRAAGTGELEVWVSWTSGTPKVEIAVSADDLSVMSAIPEETWEVPLQSLSMQATLEEQRNLWTVFAQDIKIVKDDVILRLPRLQADLWGDSLRLRGSHIDLAPLNGLLTGLSAAPQKLGDVFRTLNPRGRLNTPEFVIEDLSEAGSSWQLRSRFGGVAVDSWKGAPGVRGANGFVELGPGRGYVSLDSQPFSMNFPTVYKEPLTYNDFVGTVFIDWDSEALELSSTRVTASGVEGTAHALFGLRVPFKPVPEGIEMELLVGLQDSHPIHRTKYVPYILNDALLNWLRGSIGEGRVKDGAFLWRGSLKREAAPFRTVQLGFNVSDTALSYHEAWPGLSKLAGIVLVNDTNVSVWSEQAQMYDSRVEFLSAEAWMDDNRQMQLEIDARMTGEAADALTVVNNSPLAPLVGNAFADWSLRGGLSTRLQLGMNLNRPKELPRVELFTEISEAELTINPGRIPISGLAGEVAYATGTGFSSSDLRGSLWGEPLRATIYQQPLSDPNAPVANAAIPSPVAIDAFSEVDVADLQNWLSLPQLAFAEGRAPVQVEVRVPPGETPTLSAHSMLEGVSLALPRPWRKLPETPRALAVSLPLSRDTMILELDLSREIALALDFTGGTLAGGAMLVDAPADPNHPWAGPATTEMPALAPGRLQVAGRATLVDADEWLEFVDQYFLAGDSPATQNSPTVPAVPAMSEAVADPNQVIAASADFRVIVGELFASDLVLWGQGFEDATFSLDAGVGGWTVDAANDWLAATVSLDTDADTGQVRFERFDVAGLSTLEAGDDEAEQPAEPLVLPDLSVSVEQLTRQGVDIGELAFDLRSEGATIVADGIVGDVAGLGFSAQEPGRLSWSQGGEEFSHLTADLEFGDLGETFNLLGYQRILDTEQGESTLDLTWPGGPQDFGISRARGGVNIETSEGRFLEASAGTSGALRVVSILNLADIVRRLSLTHMFESGIPFEQLQTEAFFHAGTVEVPQMKVSGAGSGFQFSGLSNLEAGTVDGELVVTLPVANNLPWVAALAAGPAVAAGVFVVSQLFEDQVNRFSSGVYKVTGPLEEPEVTFDRIFDNTGETILQPVAAGSPDAQEQSMGFDLPAVEAADPNQASP